MVRYRQYSLDETGGRSDDFIARLRGMGMLDIFIASRKRRSICDQ